MNKKSRPKKEKEIKNPPVIPPPLNINAPSFVPKVLKNETKCFYKPYSLVSVACNQRDMFRQQLLIYLPIEDIVKVSLLCKRVYDKV